MSILTRFFRWFYLRCLKLYPAEFRDKFSDEMETVFMQAIADQNRTGETLKFFTRELQELPGSLLDAYVVNWLRGGKSSMSYENISPATQWQAFLGVLPFLAFGISSMIGKVDPFLRHNAEMAVYCLALVGLLIGWKRNFPLWSYSYLGWSLILAWSNTNISIYGVRWGYQVWIPFGITALIAFLWTRSLTPIKKLHQNIWNDWTRLTFTIFTLGAFVALIYDENHHPYLLLLMAVTIIIIILGVWFFLRSSNLIGRVISIAASFVASVIPGMISYLTWDWRAYYGLPKSDHWYDNLGFSPILVFFWLLFLFTPALIVIIQRIAYRRIA